MFAFLGVASSANAAAVSYSADATVTIDGTDYTILSGSGADSVIVSGTTLIVDPDASLTFTLVSPDGYDLNPDPETSMTCDDGVSTVVIAAAAATVTFTPNNDVIACESESSGGGGGGGGSSSHGSSSSSGGGGGSSSSSNNPPAEPGTVPVTCAPGQMFSAVTGERCTTTNVVFCSAGQVFSPTTGERCNTYLPVSGGSVTPAPAGGYAFGTVLVKIGTKGEACRAWQMFFNNKAQAGLVVDGNCGPKTMAAARAWQSVSGLVADGLLGAMSRAKAQTQ